DLHDLDIAPERELIELLQGSKVRRYSLYAFCLATRQSWRREALDDAGWRECENRGRNNGIIGGVAKNLPVGLVHWHEFDPLSFQAEVDRVHAQMTVKQLLALLPTGKHDVASARALVALGYPAVAPVLPQLLEWVQDINWPVAAVLAPFSRALARPW